MSKFVENLFKSDGTIAKITLIKTIREEFGLSLRDAKDIADAMVSAAEKTPAYRDARQKKEFGVSVNAILARPWAYDADHIKRTLEAAAEANAVPDNPT